LEDVAVATTLSTHRLARVAASGLAVAAPVAALIAFIGALSRPTPDFASLYAAVQTAAADPAANVYDYALLTRVNAAHAFAPAGFSPFACPPAALLAARPLSWLPYELARGVWLTLLYLAVLGAAVCLAHALAVVLERRPPGSLPPALTAPVVPLGRLRVPALPFALAAGMLLLALPLADTATGGQPTIVSVFLLALALDLAVYGREVAAGVALALASVLPMVVVGAVPIPIAALLALYALLLGARALAAAGLLGALVVVVAPLAAVPGASYARLAAARSLLTGTFGASAQNTSLHGLVAHLLVISEHTGTPTFQQGIRVVVMLRAGLLALTLVALLAPAVMVWRARASRRARHGLLAPALAGLLATYAVAAPLVWPWESSVISFAGLLLVGWAAPWGFAGGRGVAWATGGVAALGLVLVGLAGLLHVDGLDLPQGQPAYALALLRPAGALLIWLATLVALAACAAAYVRIGTAQAEAGKA
jgi:glycosyl transferase family 87